MSLSSEPRLQAPGKGLPLLHWVVARFIQFPSFCRKHTWHSAQEIFDREEKKIENLIAGLSPEVFSKRVLVSNIKGIEDSSRYWSPAMTIEHLSIVNQSIKTLVVKLAQNEVPEVKVKIEAVKPSGGSTVNRARRDFTQSCQEYRTETNRLTKPKTRSRLLHPWLGKLNAFEWHCLAASHMGIHRRQIQAILKG